MSKLYVSAALLEKLKCSICNAYLSIFPVNIKDDGSSPICGRCKVPNDNYFRDEGYEGIIQHFIFPCIHTKNGCSIKLTPVELKNHELCCLDRKLDCPSKTYASCKWQGSNGELLDHFEDAHKSLLLSDGKFELNFVTSVKENLLMPYDDELFIVKKEIDSRSGAFTCIVEQVVQSEEPTNYNYMIRVMTGNNTHHHSCLERSTSPYANEKITRFNAEFIREKLNDPAVIIAKIEIIKAAANNDDESSKKVDQVNNPEIEWEILEDLQCPVCYEYMVPPIYQCNKGHSICNACKPKLRACPLCKGPLSDTQNFTLEKLTGRMKYPCKHHKMGCPILLASSEIKKHENSCEYGPYLCPLSDIENCTVKCNKSEIVEHIENNHVNAILKTDKISIPFSGANEVMEKYYLINFLNKIFKICFKYETQKFRWAVQLIGPAEDSSHYKFEIDVVDNSGNKLRQYIRGFCTAYTNHEECFQKAQNCVCLLYEQISNFITENFTYRIRVLKD